MYTFVKKVANFETKKASEAQSKVSRYFFRDRKCAAMSSNCIANFEPQTTLNYLLEKNKL